MLRKRITVRNPMGLHARPASILVRIANKYESEIWISKEGERVNGKSMMGILTLAAERGSEIEMEIQGKDEGSAMAELERFLGNTNEASAAEGWVGKDLKASSLQAASRSARPCCLIMRI